MGSWLWCCERSAATSCGAYLGGRGTLRWKRFNLDHWPFEGHQTESSHLMWHKIKQRLLDHSVRLYFQSAVDIPDCSESVVSVVKVLELHLTSSIVQTGEKLLEFSTSDACDWQVTAVDTLIRASTEVLGAKYLSRTHAGRYYFTLFSLIHFLSHFLPLRDSGKQMTYILKE